MSPRTLLTLTLLAGCLPTPDVCKPTEIPPIDDTGGPPGGEICDGLDNDADGRVDEGYADINGDNSPDCSPFPEICDEFDNDYDGLVDEGFPDVDGDGIADCFDCPVNTGPAGTVPLDGRCGGGVITQDALFWSPVEEFTWSGYNVGQSEFYDDVHVASMVSPLYDDNNDGVVDGDDLPRIITSSYFILFGGEPVPRDAAMTVLDYRGGHVNNAFNEYMDDNFAGIGLNQWSPVSWLGGLAVADVDVDGSPDIVFVHRDGTIGLLDNTGSLLWTSQDRSGNDLQVGLDVLFNGNLGADELLDPVQPTVADLDSDGIPEVLAYDLVIDGQTGRGIGVLPVNANIQLTMPAVGDIDLDGEQEIIVGNNCFRADGSTCWTSPAPIEGRLGHWSAIVQGDADEQAEVLMIGNGQAGLFEDDGAQIWRQTVSANHRVAGPPCVADFDGDGISDFAWAADDFFHVYALDGTAMWSMPIVNDGGQETIGDTFPPGHAACSAFDFDNDGAYEILFADEEAFYILRGSDGFELFSYNDHRSDTVFEYPTVADFDGDGSAEIVLSSSNTADEAGFGGITVFGHPNGIWAHGGPGWQLHDYAGTNVGEAGQIPGASNHYWDDLNIYRARPGVPTEPNLLVEIVDICAEDCAEADSQIFVSVQVSNSGTAGVGAGVTVRLYGLNSQGQRIEPHLAQYVTTVATGSGEAPEGFTIRFPAIDYVSSGAVDLVAVIDPEGAFEECGEDDNTDTWGQDLCAN